MISVSSLTQVYDTKSGPVEALRDVSLAFIPGTLTAISGQAGAGKSTFVHLMSGREHPTAGTIVVDGLAPRFAPPRGSQVSLVYPALSLVSTLNVFDNVMFGCAILGVEVDEAYLASVLDKFRLSELLERFPAELTAHQQQRVAFARAFLTHADVVLADEPDRPLEPGSAMRLLALIGEAARAFGQSVIITTRSPVVAGVADRWIVLERGSVLEDILTPAPNGRYPATHLPDSLDDIAPPRKLSEYQERLVHEARRILEDLPGPVEHEEAPPTSG